MELPNRSEENEKDWVPKFSAFRRVAKERGIPVRTLYSAYRMFHKFEEAVNDSTGFLLLDQNHPAFLHWLEKDYTPYQPEKPNCWVCGKPVARVRARFCSKEHMYQWNRETGFYGEIGRKKPGEKHKTRTEQSEDGSTQPTDHSQPES